MHPAMLLSDEAPLPVASTLFSPRLRSRRARVRLCLVRHGETRWNAERRLQGHLDVPLNQTGQAQARAAAAGLFGHRFAALYSSDLARARQTAAAASRALGLLPMFDRDLRERHHGAFQGLTLDEARRMFPDAYERFNARELTFAFLDGGESLLDFAARCRAALTRIAEHHPGQQVLVVTHGGVLDIAHRLATGMPLDAPRDFAIPNAALNWIEFDGHGWRLVTWADQRHLERSLDELASV